MRILRFERKILLALVVVAALPLLASLVLGRTALQDTYNVGVNDRISAQLDGGLAMYRAYFRATRREAEAVADAVASHRDLDNWRQQPTEGQQRRLAAIAGTYPMIRSLEVVPNADSASPVAAVGAQATPSERLLTLERPLASQGATLRVTVATDAAPFRAYEQAGQVAEVYKQLSRQSDYLSGTYWSLYILCLVVVIAVAGVVAMVASRRVTKRIAVLVDATKRVGRGDMTVSLDHGSQDEIAELTRSFNEMVSDLRHSRERIDYLTRVSGWQEFAKRLAHEIKNPLTPIQLAAQEIEQRFAGADPDQRRVLQEARGIIEEEVATLRRLVGEFSSFAKLPEVQPTLGSLVDFVDELPTLVPPIEADLEGSVTIELRLQGNTGTASVMFDGMMLRRCFDNLIRNAAQAAVGAGQSAVAIDVRLQASAREMRLVVEDDGPGMDDPTRARVFQPYFTTKSEGSGLGLAIVKKVILEHGGDITCEPVTPQGTRFTIVLPG